MTHYTTPTVTNEQLADTHESLNEVVDAEPSRADRIAQLERELAEARNALREMTRRAIDEKARADTGESDLAEARQCLSHTEQQRQYDLARAEAAESRLAAALNEIAARETVQERLVRDRDAAEATAAAVALVERRMRMHVAPMLVGKSAVDMQELIYEWCDALTAALSAPAEPECGCIPGHAHGCEPAETLPKYEPPFALVGREEPAEPQCSNTEAFLSGLNNGCDGTGCPVHGAPAEPAKHDCGSSSCKGSFAPAEPKEDDPDPMDTCMQEMFGVSRRYGYAATIKLEVKP